MNRPVYQRELGYLFSRPLIADYAFCQLEMNIYHQPTGEHFDPISVVVPAIRPDGTLGRTIMTHPWHGPAQVTVAPGRIVLRDWRDKAVEAFSCGGVQSIHVVADHTGCVLDSTGPIFPLPAARAHTLPNDATLLVTVLEALLAKCRVRWGRNQMGFEQRLAGLDPLTVFVAGLYSIAGQIEASLNGRRPPLQRNTLRVVHKALDAVRPVAAELVAKKPLLTDLLAPTA